MKFAILLMSLISLDVLAGDCKTKARDVIKTLFKNDQDVAYYKLPYLLCGGHRQSECLRDVDPLNEKTFTFQFDYSRGARDYEFSIAYKVTPSAYCNDLKIEVEKYPSSDEIDHSKKCEREFQGLVTTLVKESAGEDVEVCNGGRNELTCLLQFYPEPFRREGNLTTYGARYRYYPTGYYNYDDYTVVMDEQCEVREVSVGYGL